MLKKSSLTVVILSIMTLAASTAQAAVTLVREGRPVAKIYLSSSSKTDEKTSADESLEIAAQELNYHLGKMSGTRLEVVQASGAASIEGPAIVLGRDAVALGATPQKTVDSGEGFRLLTTNDCVLVGGQSNDAVLFGVYALLEKLGCDWLMPGKIGEVIPVRKTVEVPALDESQAPDFLFRNYWYGGGDSLNTIPVMQEFNLWKRRQKSGGYDPAPLQTAGHAWEWFVPNHIEEFKKDPTMYALVRDENGQMVRRGLQIETTHPRVIELFVQDIKDAFAKNKWPHDKAVGFPIGPADTLGYSMSPESLAAGSGRFDPLTGELDRTDEMVLLANRIQERVEKEYPNVWVGFYSYGVHADYPIRYQPHPRTALIFAPITVSRFHSVLDDNSKTQPYYHEVVEKWAKLSRQQGNALIYRGYNWNLADNMLPYTKLHIWGEELPYYHRLNFMGLTIEAARSWSITGPSDWLFMKLAWNTKQDWKELLRDYCKKSFGAGAEPMREYFLELARRQRESGHEAGSYHAFHMMYDKKFVNEANAKFARAKQLAKTPEEKLRVTYFASAIETLRLYLDYHEASVKFNFAEVKKNYDAIFAHNERIQAMKADLVSPFTPIYLKRFLEEFATESEKYSSGAYRIVHRLPDEMPTLLDANLSGKEMRYFAPSVNDRNFIKTKTYSSTWDAQGLANSRGAVWYRHHFKISEDIAGKPVGLFLGGFDDTARVWLNGKYIGSSGQAFSKPAVYDLTAAFNPKGENILAIQVIHGTLNELGTGGIFRPSFLFTGPRLAQAAPELPAPTLLRPGAGEVQPEQN